MRYLDVASRIPYEVIVEDKHIEMLHPEMQSGAKRALYDYFLLCDEQLILVTGRTYKARRFLGPLSRLGSLVQIRDVRVWKQAEKSLGIVWEWLDGENHRNITKHISVARDLELDNEKRSVKLIKKFKLPIDVKLYIKKANAYVLFYNYMLITRRWCKPNNSPSRNPILLAECSDKFDMRYDKLSDDILDAFILAKI